MSKTSLTLLIALACALGLAVLLSAAGQPQPVVATAAITLFTAILWVTEAIPIPAASLIPFVAFPAFGVISHGDAATALGNPVIILLMGAFMLSKGLEKSNVHNRLAVYMLHLTGTGNARVMILAFMLTSAVLSMWISNTATCLMLLPIALAILKSNSDTAFKTALLLGIAYASSLGGIGSPVGTPPNVIFMSVYQETFGTEITFLTWMKTGVPIVIIGIPLMAWWLTRNVVSAGSFSLPQIGSWQPQEKRVLTIFALVVVAWIVRPYVSSWLGLSAIGDGTVALAGVAAMFLLPNGQKDMEGKSTGERLLDWQTTNTIPWGMLLLFAGGICIAKAFTGSGLSILLGNALSGLTDLPVWLLILCICLFVTFVTEITSNTATATLLMPILASAAQANNIEPALLMMPAAISASCAFMLPVATPANAIVYSTDEFKIKAMVREGWVLNLMVAGVATVVIYLTV